MKDLFQDFSIAFIKVLNELLEIVKYLFQEKDGGN